jgi:hypothetical protein
MFVPPKDRDADPVGQLDSYAYLAWTSAATLDGACS